MRKKHIACSFLILFLVCLGLSNPSRGAETDPKYQAYLAALKIAQKKVLRTQAAELTPSSATHALSAPLPHSILGRPFVVGETWEVAALRGESSMMRMTSDPRHLKPLKGRVGIFRYVVKEVHDSGEITIEISQKNIHGFRPIDPRIEHLTLKLNQKTVQTEKHYLARGVANPIPVSPEGLHSAMTLLELYPLDVPDILTAEKKTPSAFPLLPEELAKLRTATEAAVDLTRSIWFEQDDFFGRPIQVLWQKGDPWPAYLKTSNGISILLKKGES